MAADHARTGRRPGPSTTRQAILAAAVEVFDRVGYRAASVRGIARAAEVDPALVRRFYGGKRGLFLAAARVSYDPWRLAERLAEGGLPGLGHRLVATALTVWDSPAGATLVAAARTAPRLAAALAADLAEAILGTATATLPGDEAEQRLRVALVEVQLAGLFTTRYLLRTEPIASLPRAQLVASLGPLVQHLLTGPLTGDRAAGQNRRSDGSSRPRNAS